VVSNAIQEIPNFTEALGNAMSTPKQTKQYNKKRTTRQVVATYLNAQPLRQYICAQGSS